eukprot:TRINITY_DN2746_c1_g1_i1.p2 TRINITY_DN2746_c1_g1~~TRINITY_DN2746_c1_g1_i1.p2  ORF type:complete len:254 (-),score=22.67 TRINITY_DN2746_c1_g1_i1:2423-3184(-)
MSGVSYPSTDESIVMLCPRQMVGRVIGRSGETIRAIQLYTNATISINQRYDPSLVIIHGGNASVALASQMVDDIIKGRFKGFALLRQAAARGSDNLRELVTYVPTKGFLPKKRDVQQHPCEIPSTNNVNLPGLPNMQHLMQNELYAATAQLSPQQLSPTKVNTSEIKAYTTELLAIQYMQKQLEQKRQTLLGKVISGDDHSFTSSQSSLPALPSLDVANTLSATAPPTSATATNAAHLLPRYLLESLNEYNFE